MAYVNDNETPGCRNECCSGGTWGLVSPSAGGLIPTAAGNRCGVGGWLIAPWIHRNGRVEHRRAGLYAGRSTDVMAADGGHHSATSVAGSLGSRPSLAARPTNYAGPSGRPCRVVQCAERRGDQRGVRDPVV